MSLADWFWESKPKTVVECIVFTPLKSEFQNSPIFKARTFKLQLWGLWRIYIEILKKKIFFVKTPSNADMVVPLNEQLESWFLVWVFILTKYITGVNLSQIGQREHWFSIFPSNCSSPRNFPRGPLYAYRCPGVTQKNSAKSVKKCSHAPQITVQPGCDKSPLHTHTVLVELEFW